MSCDYYVSWILIVLFSGRFIYIKFILNWRQINIYLWLLVLFRYVIVLICVVPVNFIDCFLLERSVWIQTGEMSFRRSVISVWSSYRQLDSQWFFLESKVQKYFIFEVLDTFFITALINSLVTIFKLVFANYWK